MNLEEIHVMNQRWLPLSIHTEKTHCEFHEVKCNTTGSNFRRVAELQRTDRKKTCDQKADFREYWELTVEDKFLIVGKTSAAIQPLMCNRELHNRAI